MLNYASWAFDFSFPRMSLGRAEALVAWFDQLRGAYGTFRWQPPHSVYYAGVTTTLISTAYPTAQTISISGWSAGAATHMRPGQFIQLGDQLLRIAVAPTNADSQGHATVEFNPPLRAQYGAGTTIETAFPKGVFRLLVDDGGASGSAFQIDPDRVPEFGDFRAIEAL